MKTTENNIILFDDICILCNRLVLFIIRNDKKEIFRFASLQSPTGQDLLNKYHLPASDNDTLVLIKGNECLTQSTAVLHIFRQLSGGWEIVYAFIVLPQRFRDFCYQLVAKNRYRIFGKSASCPIPDKKLESRLI